MRRQLEILEGCQREMEQVQARYNRLLESAPDAMIFVDEKARISLANAQLEKLFGYTEDELIGRDLHILVPERYRRQHRRNVAEFFSRPRTRSMGSGLNIYALRKDGSEFPADISLSPLKTDGQLLTIASIRDITEHKQAEDMIERNFRIQTAISSVLKVSLEPIPLEEQLRRSLELILSVPAFFSRARGCIYLVEKEMDLVLKAVYGLFPAGEGGPPPPRQRMSLNEAVPGDEEMCLEGEPSFTWEPPYGRYCLPIISLGRPLGLIDILIENAEERVPELETFLAAIANTLAAVIMRHQAEAERNRFRKQLAETEKLTALGRITANVAHEIRNPLTAVGGFARRLDKRLAPGTREKDYAQFVITEVNRLETILREVLSLSRGAPLRLEECRLGEIVEEALRPFDEICAEKDIAIRKTLPPIPIVQGERERILEAIENLISNAIDAMPRGGVLAVSNGQEVMQGTAYATVRVSDTGQGIRPEVREKIFEPFFTTKADQKGIGLGLPITKRIVEDHCGLIQVESTAAAGSTFTLCFPLKAGS
jgi:PAS domain S-box-containing protein